MWNQTQNRLEMVAAIGIFYVALSGGGYRNDELDYNLIRSGSPFAGCSRHSTRSFSFLPETTSRDIITELKGEDSLHIATDTGLYADANASSLGIFSVSAAMTPDLIAFAVARDSMTIGHLDPLPFNVLLVNEGGGYDELTHYFIAPTEGIYFISFSVGTFIQETTNMTLYKNLEPFVSIRRDSTSQTGTEVIGRAIMMNMEEGDSLKLVNKDDQFAWSSELLEISFNGFRYQPAHGMPVILYFTSTISVLPK